ncbi:MAG: M48 family metalloprotease [Bacteroidales bacterium]|nr:M48 family metalloprotease [Bacteroidales bacterium]
MFSNEIRLPLEKKLGDDLYRTLEGDILTDIIAEGKIEESSNYYQLILQGHSFKAMPNLSPGVSAIFEEVLGRLEFKEPIEFYINNSPELNAFAIASTEEGQPHIVNLNSGLLQMLSDQELRFVVGHEIGHIISRNANISKLINFVYPNPARIPVLLQHKINLWQKLAELTADRYGFIANPDMASCISGFFKISSGLNAERIGFDFNAYLEENERILARFRETGAGSSLSHPINPIRIKAIQLFAGSGLYKSLKENHQPAADPALDEAINDLTLTLMVFSSSPLDQYRKQFIATAGIIMANIDEQMTEDEYKLILNSLASFTIFPSEYLDTILKAGEVGNQLMEAISKILEINPSDRYVMFDMMVSMVHTDRRISKPEITFLFDIGTRMFGMNRKEVAQLIAGNLQQGWNPELYAQS